MKSESLRIECDSGNSNYSNVWLTLHYESRIDEFEEFNSIFQMKKVAIFFFRLIHSM